MDQETLSTIKLIAELGALVIAVIVAVWRIRVALDKRDNDLEKQLVEGESERKIILHEIESIKNDLHKEFGGNSGGMREAINRISATMDRVDAKTNDLAVEIGELRGRFDQHVD